MSITFQLPQEFRKVGRFDHYATLCPTCGGRAGNRPDANAFEAPDYDCQDCMGYGGDRDAEDAYWASVHDVDGEFNVANANATWILAEVLNMHDAEPAGDIDPTTVLMRLATFLGAEAGVRERSMEQRVVLTPDGVGLGAAWFYGGRTREQIDGYLSNLERLAHLAIERGASTIEWG